MPSVEGITAAARVSMVLLTPFGAEAVLAEDFARRHAGHPVRRLAVAPDAYVSETGYALVGATGAVPGSAPSLV